MSSTKERLDHLREYAQSAQTKRIQLETKLESLQGEKQKLLDRCNKLGVTPDELDDKIQELQTSIEKGLQDLERVMSKSVTPEEKPVATSPSINVDDMPF